MAIVVPIAAGEPVLGLWCETCLLPSGYAIPIYGLFDDGPVQLTTATGCDGCGGPRVEPSQP